MIFKTIQSSVDSSKQSLALFNKDWNTYKLNFINASGGFKEKATTIFNSNDVNCLKEYNTQIQAGIRPSEAYKATMMNCTKEAKQNAVAIAKGTMTYEQATSSMKSMTLGAKASKVALKGLAMAGNMVAGMLIGMAVQWTFKAIDNWIHHAERAKEALEEASSKFEATTNEVKDLEDELKTCGDRIKELQRLSDNGTISVAEEAELHTLQEQNKELERKLALKQKEKADAAKELLEKNRDVLDGTVSSKYSFTTVKQSLERGNGATEYTTADNVKSWEELELATDEVAKLKGELDALNETDPEFTEKYAVLNDQLLEAQTRADEMYKSFSPSLEAYRQYIDAGIELTGVDKEQYEAMKQSEEAYMMYLYLINGTKEAYQALNEEQQRNLLLKRLTKKGLNDETANAVVNSLSADDLDNLWDSDFNFTPPQLKDYDNAEEYGKVYAQAWLKGVKEETSDVDNASSSEPVSFKKAWADLDTTDNDSLKNTKKDLTELAESGQLTVKAFKNVEGSDKFLEQIGLTAEEATKKINALTDSSKQLSSLKTAIGSLQDAYADKRDNKVAGADTLSKMEDTFGNLGKSWEKYKQTLGSTSSTLDKCQKAQNKLASEYINSNNFLTQLTEKNKEYYTSQLQDLGISNAEAIVKDVLKQKTEQLAQKTEQVKTAYALLNDEQKQLVGSSEELSNASFETLASLLELGNTSLACKSAIYELMLQMTNWKDIDASNSISQLLTMANAAIAAGEATANAMALANASKSGDNSAKMNARNNGSEDSQQYYANKWKDDLKNLTKNNAKIKVDNVKVNPTKSGSSGSSGGDSKQTFDLIERKLNYLASKTKKTVDSITDYISQKTKNKKYSTLLKNIDAEITANDKAAKKYQNKADSVAKKNKLSKTWIKKIQTGDYTIKEVNNSKKADAINDYITWYEKSVSASQTATEKRLEKLNKKREALDSRIENYSNKLQSLQTTADRYQYNIDLTEANGRYSSSSDYNSLSKNADKQISNLKTQNTELLKYQKTLKKNSTEWYDIQQQIDGNNSSINDLVKSQVEWNNTIQEMRLDKFENLSDLLDNIKSKFQALISFNSAQGYTESDSDIAREIKMGNNQIATNKSQINQQWRNLLEDAKKKKSDVTGFGWGLSTAQANKFKSSYQQFLNGAIDQKQFEKDLKSIGLTWEQVINNSELQEGIKSILDLETENLSIMEEQEQKYDELAQKRIDAINDYIDKLNEANDAKSKAIDLEKAQQKLQEAKQNKTSLIYHEGFGFNFESNREDVNESQAALDDQQYNAFIDKLSKVTEILEENKDDFNLYMKNTDSNGDVDTLIKKYIAQFDKTLAESFSGLEFYQDNKGKTLVRAKGDARAGGGVVTAPKGASSLVGEVSPELLVRDGQWNLIGQNGAEFIDTKPGDIIFNGKQTQELLNNGFINSRGKAFNEGTGNYESWKLVKKLDSLPILDQLNPAFINSMLETVNMTYAASMQNELSKMQTNLNMIQPRSVENNRTIHIDKVELHGVSDVQTLMRDLDHLASTINSDAKQRAWKH